MKVERSRTTGISAARKDSKSGYTGFADNLTVDEAPVAAPVTSVPMLYGIEGLFAIQGIPDTLDDRHAAARGEEILDRLEDLRRGLLLGHIGREKLGRLAALSGETARGASDPRLRELLQEIDLRAQVELAKLEMEEA